MELAADDTVRKLNKDLRGVPKPTDVLTIPTRLIRPAGALPPLKPGSPAPRLGDIIVGMEYTARGAAEDGVSLACRLPSVLAHSICHLLGHDHVFKRDYLRMARRERDMVAAASHLIEGVDTFYGAHGDLEVDDMMALQRGKVGN